MLIGLCGYAGVGKDEAAKVLLDEYGYKRVAFADPIKESLMALNPLIPYQDRHVRLHEVIKELGWAQAEDQNEEIRRLAQAMGTEVGRNILSHNLWVQIVEKKLDNRTVVTDTRFPNEARLLRRHGGILVRVERPGFGPVNEHLSDRASKNWAYEHRIRNDSTLEALYEEVRELARSLNLEPVT